MNKLRIFLLLMIVIVVAAVRTNAQPNQIQFQHLTIKDGLASNEVRDIFQDQKGFIWFCTASGLQRYDGYELLTYRMDIHHPEHSLSNNSIQCGLIDCKGKIWIGTEGGLDILARESQLADAVRRLTDSGIIVSAFIDADVRQVEAAKRIGVRVCEIHTGPYAHTFHSLGRDAEGPAVVAELDKIRIAGEAIRGLGMRFNAGHALNYFNVGPVARLAGVRELHIGHAIVSRAVFIGMREAVREMKALMVRAASGQ